MGGIGLYFVVGGEFEKGAMEGVGGTWDAGRGSQPFSRDASATAAAAAAAELWCRCWKKSDGIVCRFGGFGKVVAVSFNRRSCGMTRCLSKICLMILATDNVFCKVIIER